MASPPTAADVGLARAAASRPLGTASLAAAGRLATADWTAGVVEEGGQFHRVLVLPGVGAVRMSRTEVAAGRLPANVALVQALATTAQLPVALPVPLTEVVTGPDGTAAVVQEYLPGQAHPPHEGDPAVLRGLCEALAAVDTTALQPHLGPAFAYRGPWTPARVRTVRELPGRLRDAHGGRLWDGDWTAEHPSVSVAAFPDTVEELLGTLVGWTENPVVTPSLVHGDLAGHNMRWARAEGRWVLTGVLDWDLASAWDPALNPAYLSLWHGEEKLEAIARDPAEARRARAWLGWMALETLDDAAGREGTGFPANWPRLLRKVLPRIGRAVAALRDRDAIGGGDGSASRGCAGPGPALHIPADRTAGTR
ncbi:MAG: phosphotransferase [Micrococcus sp.]|nr:phosphotransferase [Micrococcus sp.]